MNEKLYEELMLHRPSQQQPEWHLFLQLCDIYLKKHEIKKPVVVELGSLRSRQRRFWEQLFEAEWIGIDKSSRGNPVICGDTHDPEIKEELEEMLASRTIDILFIDGGHRYYDIKKDFEDYAPLCSGIIALHDNEQGLPTKCDVKFFWHELTEWSQRSKSGKYQDAMFISLHQYRYQYKDREWNRRVGIGVILQKWT